MAPRVGLSRRCFLTSGAAGVTAAAVAGLTGPVTTARASPHAPDTACLDEPPARVSLAPSQTMEGFGASGAWWPNDLVTFDPAVQECVADHLFGPRGIALSVYRYNIGGGGVGVEHPGHNPDTFLVSPGVYDWGRDSGGRRFLQLAAERGVPILLGFVNSAPPVWTTNNRSNGGHLQPGAENAFAGYLADVVAHFHDDEGITLSYLSPMNEPRHLFEGTFQEGMGVPVEQRAALVRAVGQALAARAPYCRIIADESSRTGEHFLSDVSHWLRQDDAADYVAALALHRYDFPNDMILGLARDLAQELGKPIWSTEVSCFDSRTGSWGQQYDPTIAGGLMLANTIWQGLTVANDAAFHWWVACSPVMGCDPASDPSAAARPNDDGWNDGLLYYDPGFRENGNQQIYVTSRFFAMGQFSRYVRPGDRRHHVQYPPDGLHVLAFSRPFTPRPDGLAAEQPAAPPVIPSPVQLPAAAASPPAAPVPPALHSDAALWTVIVINNGRTGAPPETLHLRLPQATGTRLVPVVAVETSATRSLGDVALPDVSAEGILLAAVPTQSITTYVLHVESGG